MSITDNHLQKIVFKTSLKQFYQIPGNIIAYWLSDSFIRIMESEKKLNKYGSAKQGLATTDNKKYLRLWFEIAWIRIDFSCNSCMEICSRGSKWFPYNKAGSFRKWSSINEYVVNYENDGAEIKSSVMRKYSYLSNPGFVVKNTDTYFKHGITWNDVATGPFCSRFVPDGYIYDAAGPMFFSNNDFAMLAYFNSVVFQSFANIICQGLHYSTGHIPLIPYRHNSLEQQVVEMAFDNCSLSKQDWDSFETSWDFKKHPLL